MSETLQQSAKEKLKSFVERIERLEEEKAGLAGDIKDLYDAAGGEGFDKAVLRKVIALRKLDADERRTAEAVLDTYMHALGMAE